MKRESNLGIGFDDTFKADKHILSFISRENGMIGLMFRNSISREANVVVFSIRKTLIRPHIEYSIQVWAPRTRYEKLDVMLRLTSIQIRVTKQIKRVKNYSYQERMGKLGLTILLGSVHWPNE